ncbi:MAG TPA: hypothetical protein VK469_20240, partial [Candidatus Kapabacteria bacterium]|nr:hypothetical protein [Candidatus Kapabacteria bacterium]
MKIFRYEINFSLKRCFYGLLIIVISNLIGNLTVGALGKLKGLFSPKLYVAVLISQKAVDFEIPLDF